ncbi:hypothetical protein [Psychrobacter alimentarius]|uniref:hypothetical protein n=1 Tax=Psychrobacter alimentarius TaxID=261164 RepID=UPI001919494A|nr:hypothetical protein [Psychrobacter alimentarius]
MQSYYDAFRRSFSQMLIVILALIFSSIDSHINGINFANLALLMASDLSAAITGQSIAVDGA